MWTPKRILIYLAGTLLCLAGFVVYDFYLGGYDGLPPLPERYAPGERVVVELSPVDDEESKMNLAFGKESEEASRPYKLDIGSKGVLIAVRDFEIEKDGRVKLSPFSAALFPKKKADYGPFPEITTVQCQVAYLTLDKEVKTIMELQHRKIVGVELQGSTGVTITNNHRTPAKSDDIEVTIKLAPVYFEEASNRIWTEGFVRLVDSSSQPNPTEVTAKGLEMQLAKDTQPLRAIGNSTAKRGPTIGGVEKLILKSHVEMHLYMDSRSDFLAGAPDLAGTTSVRRHPPAAEKSHVVVKTAGRMYYDVVKDLMQFDSPELAPGATVPNLTEQVLLTREHRFGPNDRKYDQLVCDCLKLAFRRRTVAPPVADAGATTSQRLAPREPLTGSKEIEAALATARPGQEVTLSMDTENLEAWGAELDYRSATATSGAQTILRGRPMHAIRDGNLIEALELHLVGPDKNGQGQQGYAKGPGRIDMLDKATPQKPGDKQRFSLHAVWKDSLVWTKDRDGDKVYDLLTLTGEAAFIDDDHQQSLHGQRLQVWFESTQAGGSSRRPNGSSRQEPHRLEAFDRVHVRSPEILIDKCQHLVLVFKPTPASDAQLPPPETPSAPQENDAKPGTPGLGFVGQPGPSSADTPAKDRRPIRLSANRVVAYVAARGAKKQVEEVVSDGDVLVRQDGATPRDKGLDIAGAWLNMLYHPLGNRLIVSGDARRPARLQAGEMTLIGPKIDIDQKENSAVVDGVGAMRVPSKTGLDGTTPAKEGTYITVQWNKDMIFNGKLAEFHGGVQAFQDQASLKCAAMQVTFDKYISFREGQKQHQDAKLEKLVCEKEVFAEEKVLSPQNKLISWKRLMGTLLDMDNPDHRHVMYGPGRVDYLAWGNPELTASPSANQASTGAAKHEPVLKLTRIDYKGRLFGSNKPGGPRMAIFYDDVEVYHQPGDDPDIKVNPNQPPKGGFYMRCGNLNVALAERDGKSTQYMVAKNNAFFRTPEFYGSADTIKYDESQEMVIFEGNPAQLFRLNPMPGGPPQRITGQKILYNRRNGNFTLDGGQVISSH
ncbi:MAG: hypothetical protein NZO58_00170 [Gemmataceae bacterium]|nr:hypothetical protein [Gemmataceae bacterium]